MKKFKIMFSPDGNGESSFIRRGRVFNSKMLALFYGRIIIIYR